MITEITTPVEVAAIISLLLIFMALVLTFIRMILGPSLPDKIVALDLIAMLVLGIIISYVALSKQIVYLNAIVLLALIAFLGTVAFARYLEKRIL
ncbi:MAG: monovalent cation/H+ antiporter complex subunit F [bacterium]|nr:monovalent cation/H+ antiporter complex subunit F [bacterium]